MCEHNSSEVALWHWQSILSAEHIRHRRSLKLPYFWLMLVSVLPRVYEHLFLHSTVIIIWPQVTFSTFVSEKAFHFTFTKFLFFLCVWHISGLYLTILLCVLSFLFLVFNNDFNSLSKDYYVFYRLFLKAHNWLFSIISPLYIKGQHPVLYMQMLNMKSIVDIIYFFISSSSPLCSTRSKVFVLELGIRRTFYVSRLSTAV